MTLQIDFFLSQQDKLWLWCKQKKLFSSIDITRYGLQNYYLRAPRTVRQWCEGEASRLRRLSTDEKMFRGLLKDGNVNIAWYEVINGAG